MFPPRENHFVLFHENDSVLRDRVRDFIAGGLDAGEPVVVIATRPHLEIFRDALERESFDIGAALRSGHLCMLDAGEALASFMAGGTPDPQRFEASIGAQLKAASGGRPRARVRAYDEMVDLLCHDGQIEAAIEVERLWNELAKRYTFSLFCAYVHDRFAKDPDGSFYARICAAHTHVHTASPPARARETSEPNPLARIREAGLREAGLREDHESPAFRLLVESVRDYAIFMLDPRGVVASWNTGARRIKGYERSEIVGQHFSRFYPESDVLAGKCEYELEVAGKEGRFEDEGWRIRKDGSRFWANVIITAVRNEAGELVGFAKVTRDLTERRRAEEERQQLARAEEANRVKDTFLAMVSHELRTPLNAILGWGMLLQSRVSDPETTRALETIVRNAQAQVRLIDDLLDVSRIINGKLKLELGPANLASIVVEAIETVRPSAEAKGLKLELDRRAMSAQLLGDAIRLKQAVLNLLVNAVKFTDRGGSIFVRLEQQGSTLRLTVRDTGKGIEPTFLPHVFERFRQEGSDTQRAGGLGLGLAIVRHLIHQHGGDVKAESEGKGKGATFTLTLPVSAFGADKAFSHAETQPPSGTRLDGIKVLVIEDEPDALELIEVMLQERGAAVVTAWSAAAARTRLETFRPQVILSDIGMPGEDGYQFARSIRQLPRDRGGDIPLIALTGFASAGERRSALDAGFNNHVQKPVDPEELASVIRNAISFGLAALERPKA